MEDESRSGWLGWAIGIAIAIVIGIILWFSGAGKYEGESAEYWFDAYDTEATRVEELEDRISDLETALQEANDNIEEANSQINEAQDYAWTTYEEMGEALESLSTVDTVSEP